MPITRPGTPGLVPRFDLISAHLATKLLHESSCNQPPYDFKCLVFQTYRRCNACQPYKA